MANILVVDDDRNIRRLVAAALEDRGHRVVEAAGAEPALEHFCKGGTELVVSDIRLAGMDGMKLLAEIKKRDPGAPVILMTAFGSIPSAVEAMRLGAYDYLPKPFSAEQIRRTAARALEVHTLRAENSALKNKLRRLTEPRPFLVFSAVGAKLIETAKQAAQSDATILLTGESGVGKTLLARDIHQNSRRAAGPFVEVACTTLTETLLESELFGHERGAFTNAIRDKPGRLEAADGGTVFLDEIGELTTTTQTKLLRFLQERVFERVGGLQTIRIDTRVIAATNQELEQLVREKRFREDLWYRLNVIELRLPPLRERAAEIVPLARVFVEEAAGAHRKPTPALAADAADALRAYQWPGNARELRNVIERAVILTRAGEISAADLPDRLFAHASPPLKITAERGMTLEELERAHIEQVLQQAITLEEAADMLGINVTTLWRKRRRYGLG